MKKILGLDLGTTSIGWAMVNEAETAEEQSSIIKLGARIISYDNFVSRETGKEIKGDPADFFRAGKGVSPNAARTQSRSMRRNLQRYKLRRENLIEILKEHGFISDESILSENGNRTTFETYRLRAKAATEEISLEEFARVLLMINKKRGYKSSRKAKRTEDGTLIDGKDIAIILHNENLTVGQYSLRIIQSGKKDNNAYYPSDLQAEFDRIWIKQNEFYPEILTDELKEELRGKKRDAVWAICAKHFIWTETEKVWNNDEGRNEEIVKEYKLVGMKREGKADDQKKENLLWRTLGLSEKLSLEQLVICLQEINMKINGSSGYLGAISDRSKGLYFNKQTVGQYQMAVLAENPNASLRNMVFYRQDYLDEFNALWIKQAEFHKELTNELKNEIRDVVIFYQRRLKSQKGLISFCEFESRQIEVEIDGKKKIKTVGSRVIPRSSPLFQEFKIWQILNNIELTVIGKKGKRKKQKDNSPSLFDGVEDIDQLDIRGRRFLDQDEKELLANELFVRDKLSKSDVLKLLFENPQELDLNFKTIDGNKTGFALFQAYSKIIEISGYEPVDFKKPADNIIKYVKEIFTTFAWNTDILQFDADTELDKQYYYRLWHLLYSFEGDNTPTGAGNLIQKITDCYGFDKEYATILANVTFQDDYGSLSAKAIRKILPHLKEGFAYAGRKDNPDESSACVMAGYGKHSKSSLTTEELEVKVYKNRLDILPKNSLRNPVVEKILNQMINVINTIIDAYGKPDEIRVELARELKKNADERGKLDEAIRKTTIEHEEIKKKLQREFGISNVSRNDIIRYKLYKELEPNGYKTLYSNTYIPQEKLFSKEFDIEHIIPQSRLFDDSFSNKTLELRSINIEKGNQTAYDFITEKYDDRGLEEYLNRIEALFKDKKTKLKKLKMTEHDIPNGFIDSDLRNTQYIAKKALEMLNEISRRVVATTGSITDQLREDWGLIDLMQKLNWDKYDKLGLTETVVLIKFKETGHKIEIDVTEFCKSTKQEKLDKIQEIKEKYRGQYENIRIIHRIKDWTKRNDHRHHAMDALTVAFTKDAFIQYFNNKNASFTPNSNEYALKNKYFDSGKAIPPMPLNEFRAEAKKHLENMLISIKSKNKVVTDNINQTKKKRGTNKKIQQTPRGQLHNETIYGSSQQYVTSEVKIGSSFDEMQIAKVCKPAYREVLLKRLHENGNDPTQAFTGKNALSKKPIYLDDEQKIKIPEKVKMVTLETIYTIRKPIDKDLSVGKVVDRKIKTILENRLKEFNNDPKKAFANLDENPIWLNKEKRISIKRVTITAVNNAESLHTKKDKDGKPILDKNGNEMPVDFVNTGSNHHVAVYHKPVLDKNGQVMKEENGEIKYELEENVVSFYDAVKLSNLNLPIIIDNPKIVWDKVISEGIDDQIILRKLPKEDWKFLFSIKQNEYFVFPKTEKREKVNEETGEITEEEVVAFNPKDYNDDWFKKTENYALISQNLFRVQKFGDLSTSGFWFRHHLETIVAVSKELKGITYKVVQSAKNLNDIVKVRVNHIGQIVSVGEY